MPVTFEKAVAEDLNLGFGAINVTNPAGGLMAGNKIGIHTFLNDVYNVMDFGATGDGATNDSAAIQAAFDEAPAGAIVFFPPGTYRVANLTVPDGLTLMGAGRTSLLKYKDASSTYGFILRDDNEAPVDNVRITALAFEGNDATGSFNNGGIAIRFYLGNNIEVDHCYFTNFYIGALTVGYTATECSNLRFHHNHVYGGASKVTAIGFWPGSKSRDVWATDNLFNKVARPITVELLGNGYCINGHFDRNTIRNGAVATASATNTYLGIQLSVANATDYIRNVTITGNLFDTNVGAAASVSSDVYVTGTPGTRNVYGITVADNVSFGFTKVSSNDDCFYFSNADDLNIHNNTLMGAVTASTRSFVIVDCTYSVVGPNRIQGTNWTNALSEIATKPLYNVYYVALGDDGIGVSLPNITTSQSHKLGRGSSGAGYLGLLANNLTLTGLTTINVDDAVTNAVTDTLNVWHTTTGTAQDGIGVGISLKTEDASGNVEEAANIDAVFTTAAHATQAAKLSFGIMGAEKASLTGAGLFTATSFKATTLPAHANNAAALAGGLTAGMFYRTGGDPDAVCVVH